MQNVFKTTQKFGAAILGLTFSTITINGIAQVKEVSQELSKPAKKGMLDDAILDKDGNIRITYKMKVDKKSDVVNFEDYVFDADLNYKGIQPYNGPKDDKQIKPDYNLTTLSAYVGGSNSFNVLSMTLKFEKEVWEKKWNLKKQKYEWGKRLSKETIKMKDADGRYKGFANYPNDDDGSQLVIATYDGKGDNDQFLCLYATNDLNIKETKVPATGSYSLAFCGQLPNNNVFVLLAPNKGNPNTNYVYAEFSNTANLISSFEFAPPSPNTAITDFQYEDGALYLLGGSTKNNDPYNKVFASYAPIDNPGFSTSKNLQMSKYEKEIKSNDFANIHFIKIADNKIQFLSSIPTKSIKDKVKTPPSQKKGEAFDGNKFWLEGFKITPQKEFLIAGQLYDTKIVNGGNSIENRYGDNVCLHLTATGELKAQYAVEKVNDDRKSEVFRNRHNFNVSSDGKTIFWEILEVKGSKGYDSWVDAYNGNATFRANYFPRIAKINANDATVSDFTVLANGGKFLMYKYHTFLTSKDGKTTYYLGHDEDYEKLWIAKYQFN